MELRTASAADWSRIIEIYNHAVVDGRCTADTEPVTVDGRRDWLKQHADERYPIRLAEVDGIIVGWCSLSPYRPGRKALSGVAEISYYIDREHRGKGYADKLINDAFIHADNHDLNHLIAILLDNNRPSLQLLRKHGFKRWGELPGIVDFGALTCGQYIYGKKLSPKAGSACRIAAIL